MAKPPRAFRLWSILAGLFVVSSTAYYVNDQDQYERNVNNTVEFLKSPDPEVVNKALTDDLEKLMWDEKRLLSAIACILSS